MVDTKLSGLTEDTAPGSDSLVETIDDPGGTPANRKTTIANLTKGLNPSALTNKATPVAADEMILGDSEASNVAKAVTLTALDTALRGITGVEAAADVTDATNVDAAGAVMESDYNAQTVLAATADNTPAALTVGEQTLVGRITGGNVAALTATQARTIVTSEADVNAETASFTFALADKGLLTTISNAGATTATIPPNSTVAFPVNSLLYLEQIGAGACTWTPGAGVTINYDSSYVTLVTRPNATSYARKTATDTWTVGGGLVPVNPLEAFIVAASDEGTALTTGTAKVTFRMPYAFTLTDIKASVGTAPTDATLIVDVKEGGTSIMTTNKLDITTGTTIDDGTATLTDTALAEDAVMTIDITQIGSTVAGAGLKVTFIGRRT